MRFKFVTKNSVQRKYLALILSSIALPLLIAGGCLYYLMFQIMAEQLAIPEAIACNLIPVLKKINFLLIIAIPPIAILLFILAAILTHKLIGPIDRMERDLKKISDGNYSLRIRIRKDDNLRPMAEAINKIIDQLEKRQAG